jgi:acetoin utilization deacetylase AcuC-like enzyme
VTKDTRRATNNEKEHRGATTRPAVAYTAAVTETTGDGNSRGFARRCVHEVRRAWRRMNRRWTGSGLAMVYHTSYENTLPAVPLDPERSAKVLAFLTEEGLFEADDLWVARAPALRAMLRVHDPDYIESLQHADVVERIFGAPLTDEELEKVVEMQRFAVGGTIQATRLALQNRGVAVNLGGGHHHATRHAGLGFCLFNDIAVAVARLRSKGFREPVLIVDLDVHDGNGTREIFAQDPTVHTYSIHNEHWGDTDGVASTSIALGDGVGDEVYLGTLLKTLPDVFAATDPGLVIYLAGTDIAVDDALGNWKITSQSILVRDQFVIEMARRSQRRMPIAIVLGGGYGPRAWRYTARFLGWLIRGRVTEPPQNEELTLQRFRRIRGTIDPTSLTSEPGDFDWKLTEDDLAGIFPGTPRRTRFLAHFSRHGVELLLERFGILDQLRMRGFDNPTVDVDLTHPVGQTVRIFGGPERDELLMELRVNRDMRLVPGCELLVIEWLLLQNPRADFGPYRRPLPGQAHPGLGMLKEVFTWLVVVAEELGLDGIGYVPSTYHVASQSRRLVAFVDPAYEAWMRRLEELFAGRPLAEASQLVADGKVIIEATGEPLRWKGYAMVLPVSEKLKAKVSGEAYDRVVEETLQCARLQLAE